MQYNGSLPTTPFRTKPKKYCCEIYLSLSCCCFLWQIADLDKKIRLIAFANNLKLHKSISTCIFVFLIFQIICSYEGHVSQTILIALPKLKISANQLLVYNFPAVMAQYFIGLSFYKSRSKTILDSSAEKAYCLLTVNVI